MPYRKTLDCPGGKCEYVGARIRGWEGAGMHHARSCDKWYPAYVRPSLWSRFVAWRLNSCPKCIEVFGTSPYSIQSHADLHGEENDAKRFENGCPWFTSRRTQ